MEEYEEDYFEELNSTGAWFTEEELDQLDNYRKVMDATIHRVLANHDTITATDDDWLDTLAFVDKLPGRFK